MAEQDDARPEDDDVHLDEPSDGDPGEWHGPPAVLMGRSVQETIWNHAESDTAREVGGILVGRVVGGPRGTMVEVETALPAKHAEAGSAHVTFTHESWNEWYEALDTRFQGLAIVGWYHSHPNFGIFLSEHDHFIQRNFFSQPWQVAVVVDPVRREMGCFGWDEGRVARLSGDRVYQTLERRPVEEAAEFVPEAIPMTAVAGSGGEGRSFAERAWWLGWGVCLALFVVLFMQAYGMAHLQGLSDVKNAVADLQVSVNRVQQSVQGLQPPAFGRWYTVPDRTTLGQVCDLEYGREELAAVVQVINGLRDERLSSGDRVWLPAREALIPEVRGVLPTEEPPTLAPGEDVAEPAPVLREDRPEDVGPPSPSPDVGGEAVPGAGP